MAKLLLVAAGALIDRDGRILLARRRPGKPLAGLWEFPGGKLAEGETPEQALVRELREELGIETDESCLAPIAFASQAMGEQHLLMPLFVCRKWKGTPRPLDADEIRWVRPEALQGFDMPPADIPLAAQLRDFL